MITPTEADMERIAAHLEGTCKSIDAALSSLDMEHLDGEDVESRLPDFDVELCSGCGWWMAPCELVDEDCDVVGCPDCRAKEDE